MKNLVTISCSDYNEILGVMLRQLWNEPVNGQGLLEWKDGGEGVDHSIDYVSFLCKEGLELNPPKPRWAIEGGGRWFPGQASSWQYWKAEKTEWCKKWFNEFTDHLRGIQTDKHMKAICWLTRTTTIGKHVNRSFTQ